MRCSVANKQNQQEGRGATGVPKHNIGTITVNRAQQQDDVISVVTMVRKENDEFLIYSNCELGSHADTSVGGTNFAVLEYTDLVIKCILSQHKL